MVIQGGHLAEGLGVLALENGRPGLALLRKRPCWVLKSP